MPKKRRDRGAAAEDPPQRGPLPDLFHEPDRPRPVTERDQPRLHGDTDGRARIHGVDAEVVVEEVETCDDVEVGDAAIPAMRPDRLVLRLLRHVLSVLVDIDPGALDHASAMAAVGGESSPLHLELRLHLSADLGRVLEPPRPEVVRGVGARLVEDVGQHVGAVGGEPFPGDGVLSQPLDEPAVRILELLRVFGGPHLQPGVVQDDRLDPFRPHDGAGPAAPAMPRRPFLRVGAGDGSGQQLHLPRGADGHVRRAVAVLALQLLDEGVVREILQAVVDRDLDAVLVDEDLVEIVPLRLPLQHDRGVPQPRQHLRRLSAGVRFLDPSREGALASHRDPPTHRRRRAAEGSRGNNELVLRAKRMAKRVDLPGDDRGGHRPPAEAGELANRLGPELRSAFRPHVDPQNLVHVRSPFLPVIKSEQMFAVDREKSSNTCAVTGPDPLPCRPPCAASALEKVA